MVGDNRGAVTVYRIVDPITITHEGPIQQMNRLKQVRNRGIQLKGEHIDIDMSGEEYLSHVVDRWTSMSDLKEEDVLMTKYEIISDTVIFLFFHALFYFISSHLHSLRLL